MGQDDGGDGVIGPLVLGAASRSGRSRPSRAGRRARGVSSARSRRTGTQPHSVHGDGRVAAVRSRAGPSGRRRCRRRRGSAPSPGSFVPGAYSAARRSRRTRGSACPGMPALVEQRPHAVGLHPGAGAVFGAWPKASRSQHWGETLAGGASAAGSTPTSPSRTSQTTQQSSLCEP